METINKEQTIAEMVTADFRKAGVFRKYGIDFCCGGKKPLARVAEEKKLDLGVIEAELKNLDIQGGEKATDANSWKVDFLADYIVNVHHTYVRNTNPNILAWAQKVAKVHGDRFPYLVEVGELVTEVVNELDAHMMKEENVLFPYIKLLAQDVRQGKKPEPPFGTVGNPIRMMEMEHEAVGENISKIRALTNDYTPGPEACNTWRVLFSTLREFEDDLFLHIHLENNILFPKALKIEETGKE